MSSLCFGLCLRDVHRLHAAECNHDQSDDDVVVQIGSIAQSSKRNVKKKFVWNTAAFVLLAEAVVVEMPFWQAKGAGELAVKAVCDKMDCSPTTLRKYWNQIEKEYNTWVAVPTNKDKNYPADRPYFDAVATVLVVHIIFYLKPFVLLIGLFQKAESMRHIAASTEVLNLSLSLLC
jgi:hypothetical protein